MTWDGTERRNNLDIASFQLMQETREMVKEQEALMDAKFGEVSVELEQQRKASEQRHHDLAARIDHMSNSTIKALESQNHVICEIKKMIQDAFVNGDPREHRLEHEEWHEKKEADREFWLDIKKKAVGAIVTGVIVWAGLALWTAFLNGPK